MDGRWIFVPAGVFAILYGLLLTVKNEAAWRIIDRWMGWVYKTNPAMVRVMGVFFVCWGVVVLVAMAFSGPIPHK